MAALKRADTALSERQPAQAMVFVQEAEKIAESAPAGDHTARIERMRFLCTYVTEFWGAFDQGIRKLSGQDLDVGGTVIHIQDVSLLGIRYRKQGRNHKKSRQEIPAGIVRAIAERWLDKSANSKIFVGAFMAVDPGYSHAKAREMWKAARTGGAQVGDLVLVLDDISSR